MSLWLRDHLDEVLKENQRLKNEKESAKQDWLNESLRDQLLKLQERFYGRGRESLAVEQRPIESSKGSQLTLHADHTSLAAESAAENAASFPVASDICYITTVRLIL